MITVTDQGAVGPAIRAARQHRGLSLRALAAELGVSPATLSGIERGTTQVTVDRLERLSALLQTTGAALLNGEVPVSVIRTPTSAGPDWRRFAEIATNPILDAAVRLFVRQGFHATTMREVASEARLSVAGVYHHYPSKERLLVAILEITMNEIGWRIETARSEGGDAADSFALMVEALALFHAVRGDLAFIGASEMRSFSPEERARMTARRDDVQHALDEQARLGVEAGVFRVEDLPTATRAIATMCTSLPSWFRLGGRMAAEDVARQYARYSLTILGWTPDDP